MCRDTIKYYIVNRNNLIAYNNNNNTLLRRRRRLRLCQFIMFARDVACRYFNNFLCRYLAFSDPTVRQYSRVTQRLTSGISNYIRIIISYLYIYTITKRR